MASHGAMKEVAPEAPKSKPKELVRLSLAKAENGGAMAQHEYTNYEQKPEVHVFGAEEGGKLAAHIEKHLGIKMPGKSMTDKAASEEQESSEHEE